MSAQSPLTICALLFLQCYSPFFLFQSLRSRLCVLPFRTLPYRHSALYLRATMVVSSRPQASDSSPLGPRKPLAKALSISSIAKKAVNVRSTCWASKHNVCKDQESKGLDRE